MTATVEDVELTDLLGDTPIECAAPHQHPADAFWINLPCRCSTPLCDPHIASETLVWAVTPPWCMSCKSCRNRITNYEIEPIR